MKISEMTLKTAAGTDELEVNDGGVTKKVTAAGIAALAAVPTAAGVSFNNATSGLTATTVQAALDQTDARVDALAGAPAPTAAGVSFNNTASGLSATTVQAALDQTDARVDALAGASAPPKVIQIACSDETTALTAGVGKATFRMPYAMTVTAVRASLTTAQASGSIFTVDINENGASIISTKLTIDNTEKTSVTAATPPVISDAALADDSEITIDIDQIGDGTAKGLKISIIGT